MVSVELWAAVRKRSKRCGIGVCMGRMGVCMQELAHGGLDPALIPATAIQHRHSSSTHTPGSPASACWYDTHAGCMRMPLELCMPMTRDDATRSDPQCTAS